MGTATFHFRHCRSCPSFLREEPDYTEIEVGCDEEYEDGPGSHILRTMWADEIQYRTCRQCGEHNVTTVAYEP